MSARDMVIVLVSGAMGVLLTLRGGSAEILGALCIGVVIGRMMPVVFPERG